MNYLFYDKFAYKKPKPHPKHLQHGAFAWTLDYAIHYIQYPNVIGYTNYHFWYKYGKLHRVDGPAMLSTDLLYQAWYQYDKLHRVDGPALIQRDSEQWFYRGKKHRKNGPALIYTSPAGMKTFEYWRHDMLIKRYDEFSN